MAYSIFMKESTDNTGECCELDGTRGRRRKENTRKKKKRRKIKERLERLLRRTCAERHLRRYKVYKYFDIANRRGEHTKTDV